MQRGTTTLRIQNQTGAQSLRQRKTPKQTTKQEGKTKRRRGIERDSMDKAPREHKHQRGRLAVALPRAKKLRGSTELFLLCAANYIPAAQSIFSPPS